MKKHVPYFVNAPLPKRLCSNAFVVRNYVQVVKTLLKHKRTNPGQQNTDSKNTQKPKGVLMPLFERLISKIISWLIRPGQR